MTYRTCIRLLSEAGIEEAAQEARILFLHFGKYEAAALVLDNPDCPSPELAEAVKRRQKREPLPYITRKAYFYNEEYIVSPHCLIPRSDTELLVEQTLLRLPKNAKILDVCTGSGCVAISIAANGSGITALACDISSEALALAEKNARENGVGDKIRFYKSDVLADSPPEGSFDAIVSNPPYIETGILNTLEPELSFEPRIALDGGEDGMVFYRKIVYKYKQLLSSNGFFAFEIGYNQADSIRKIAEDYSMTASVLKDLGGRDRVAILTPN